MIKIAVYPATPELQPKAAELAARLNLPVIAAPSQDWDYLLILTPDYIGIQATKEKHLPLYIDFLSAKMTYRRKHASLRKEILARALGLKKNSPATIIDLTAGLGRDSFILASLGFAVTLYERSPIIQVLLTDGMQRAALQKATAPIMARMQLHNADALQHVTPENTADIIYLDPMFPPRSKSALVKKDMRIFHDIAGNDSDADQLLTLALTCARQRVVVKRPRTSEHLAGIKPAFSMTGSSSRFDVYLI